MASASPVVTGDGVIENDTSAVNAVFHYSLPALAAPETYDWALIPHRLRPGTDFIPYQSTQTYPAGPASSGTIKIPVFPDLLPEEHGGLRLIARPSTAPTWADSMSAPVSPLEFNALNADYEVLYWQDDLVVARRSIYATQTTYLDTYERSADGTLTLRSTIQLGPNLYSAGIRVSRYAMVVFKDGQLHTWLRNPEAPFTWVKKTIQYGTATGQVFLAEDRLGLELNNEFLVYRLDPALATGWRMTGTTGFNIVILFREDFVVVPHFGASMQILERSQTTEDSWRPVYQITEAPGQWPYAVTGAEGIIAVAGVNGVEIHERLTQDGGWARTATLPVPDTGGGNEISLALAGDWLAVGRGNRFDETKPEGTVKLYLRDAVNRGIWKPAGTLQGPGPGYGLNLFWNRGELISNAHDGYTPHQVVVRKFQGGEVMVRDDDRSKLSIAVSPHPEPASGSSEAECYAELPLPAETDVLVTHDFISGTAVAGQDFTALNGSVLINKGQRRTTIPFTLLADDLVEPEEFLTIRMATAGQAAVEVSANIWNSNMPPVVIGSATPLLEGLGESTLTLRQVPVTGTSLPTGPVSVGIEVGGIENPPATLPLSTSGLDLPGMRDGRLLSAAVPAASFNVRANQDEVEEAAGEAVSAWFSLPEGLLSPGTLGLVHEGWLPALPANITGPAGIGRITAGRGWIFGLKSGTSVAGGPPQGVVACYRIADTGSPRLATPQILKLDIDPNSTCELDTDGETLAVSTVLTIHDAPWNVLRLYQRTGPVAAPWEPSLEFSRYAGYSPVGIAERVNDQDVHGERGGADVRRRHIRQEGERRAGVQE